MTLLILVRYILFVANNRLCQLNLYSKDGKIPQSLFSLPIYAEGSEAIEFVP